MQGIGYRGERWPAQGEREQDRRRHITGAAREVFARGRQRCGECLGSAFAIGVAERTEMTLHQPDDMRGQQRHPDRDGNKRRTRTEMEAAPPPVQQRGECKSEQQKQRPIFSEHGRGGAGSGERQLALRVSNDRIKHSVVAAHSGGSTMFKSNRRARKFEIGTKVSSASATTRFSASR